MWKDYHQKVTALMMLCVLVGLAIGIIVDTTTQRNKRQAYKDEVKERCKAVHNEMEGNSVTTTYECPDGVTYSFSENI